MKETSELKTYSPSGTYVWNPPSGWTPSAQTQTGGPTVSFNRHRTVGDNFPSWKERLALGLDTTTYLYGEDCKFKAGYALFHSYTDSTSVTGGHGEGQFAQMMLPTQLSHDLSLESLAMSRAATQFAKKVRQHTQGWAGGVFAGELVEAARLLASPVRTLRHGTDRLISDLIHRRKHQYGRLSWEVSRDRKILQRMLHDTWLEWVYAIKPTVNDCIDAANTFNRIASGRKKDVIRITADGVDEYVSFTRDRTWPIAAKSDPGGYTAIGFPPGYSRFRTLYRADCRYRGVVSSASPSGDLPLAMQLGVGWMDVVPTAWELIPFSFLLDYFANIGDVLDVWSMRFISFDWLNRTVRNRVERRFEGYDVDYPEYQMFSIVSPPMTVLSAIERKAISNDDFGIRLTVRHPKWGSTKWLNIAALSSAILHGRSDFYGFRG